MASSISELYPAGCIVWYKLQGWPWWPSKVEEVVHPREEGQKETIAIRCFKTEDAYLLDESTKSHNSLKSFDHEGVEDLVIKAKKSCHKRKSIYADYCEALNLAVEYMREHTGDPEFSLGIDPYADVSTLSHKKSTPGPNQSRTPRTGSQVKRSSMRSSTGGEAPKSQPKSTATTTSSTSKRGRNGRVVDAAANSPVLADAPEHSSEDKKLESSKRKRTRDSLSTEGDERAPAEAKRQRTNTEESGHLSGEKEEGGGRERGKEVVPKKLNFNDEETMDGAGPSDLSQVSPPHSIQKNPSKEQGRPDSSPVSKAEHQPSSPCGRILSNGFPSELPTLDSGEGSKGESTAPVGGDMEEKEPRHMETESGEVGGLPCSSKRSEDDESNVMSTEASEGNGGFSDSDDDSMPTFSCKVEENLTLKNLRPNSIIWVKYSSKFPFWPALVVKTERSRTGGSAQIARVLFFGYNEKFTTKVRDKKRIAPFATKRTEEFMEEGRRSQYKTEFEQAVDEAKTCMEYRMKSDETTSTPRKLFDQVAKLRPKEYTKKRYECPMGSSSKMDVGSASQGDEEAASDAGSDQDEFLTGLHRLPFTIDNDEETNPDLDNSDDEKEDPMYSYDRVMEEVAELRSVLMDITQGKLASEFHRKMLEGSRKEKSQLKVAPKAGPIAKWSTSKLTNLIEKLTKISEEASDGKLKISHAYDVLLPEFAVRVMMKFENLSESEALMKLDHNITID